MNQVDSWAAPPFTAWVHHRVSRTAGRLRSGGGQGGRPDGGRSHDAGRADGHLRPDSRSGRIQRRLSGAGGAAIWSAEADRTAPRLLQALDPDRRARLSAGAPRLSVPDAAERAARAVLCAWRGGRPGARSLSAGPCGGGGVGGALTLAVSSGCLTCWCSAWVSACSAKAPEALDLALTFDDGPDPATTPAVLDALAASGARATFFVLVDAADAHPELIARLLEEGHQVEPHAVKHRHAWIARPGERSGASGGAARLAN